MTTAMTEKQAMLGVVKDTAERWLARECANGGKISIESPVGRDNGHPDLLVKFPTGTKWAVEILTRGGDSSRAMRRKAAQAIRFGDDFGATAVVAKLSGKEIEYISARTGRALAVPG